MNILFLRLEGPLQSWGLRAHWEERDTANAPTKSGVIGLLGCALGLRRDDDQLRALSEALRMGVRMDLPGTPLTDYHTTGGAKAPDSKPEGVLGVDGKRKPETDVSRRYYLADASFLVALQGPDATIVRLAEALQAPVWPLYLGRKSCPPSTRVFEETGEYPNLETALISRPLHERAQPPLRMLIETLPGTGVRQNDAISVPARRVFLPRFVAESFWSPDDSASTINTFE